jgi:glycerol kinase
MDIHIGSEFALPCSGLATMVAWNIGGKREFLFEGMLPVTGSAVQWLVQGAEMIETPDAAYDIAMSVPDSGGVYFVVTLAGAYVPRYDPYARGAMFGISHSTKRAHIVRATIEGIAFGLADIMDVVESGSNLKIQHIKIDGGASKNDLLAQSFADYIRCDVYRSESSGEATALGAAMVAAIGIGLAAEESLPEAISYESVFKPQMPEEESRIKLGQYRDAVYRSTGWLKA